MIRSAKLDRSLLNSGQRWIGHIFRSLLAIILLSYVGLLSFYAFNRKELNKNQVRLISKSLASIQNERSKNETEGNNLVLETCPRRNISLIDLNAKKRQSGGSEAKPLFSVDSMVLRQAMTRPSNATVVERSGTKCNVDVDFLTSYRKEFKLLPEDQDSFFFASLVNKNSTHPHATQRNRGTYPLEFYVTFNRIS